MKNTYTFNYRGRLYTKAYLGGMSKSMAEEKIKQRRKLAPAYIWAIHKEKDGTYSLGRALRK
jgi:hypothetical protein